MAQAGSASWDGSTALNRWVSIGAIALSVVYAALVMAWASPVSFYTLDDPYIHMALAENIARGAFGVNLNEVSNPSSSILWPWLLAVFDRIGLLLWAPLLINIACFVASVRIALAFALPRLAPGGANVANALVVLGLGLLAFNLFGVMFTGMEHSLHVLLSLVAVTRVIDGKYDALALGALVIGPLVRFEGAVVLALGVGAALVDRKWVFAALAAVLAVGMVGLYSLWLASLGLPVLPSSVLSKSAASSGLVDGGGGVGASLVQSLVTNALAPAGPMCGVLCVGLIYAAVKRRGRDRILAGGLIATLVLAMMVGKMNSYARYEVYLLVVLGMGVVHLLQPELRMLLGSRARSVILGGGLALLGEPLGLWVAVTTPQAARNIYHQQYQMHRLAECWGKPVAINDLGWVSLRNDQYVLDLYGLGNEAARKARASGEAGWMKRFVDEKGVGLAVIYDSWFPDRPSDWVLAGTLTDDSWLITPAESVVQIYATRPDAVAPIQACMRSLTPPQNVRFETAAR